jgi:HSP20 family protein
VGRINGKYLHSWEIDTMAIDLQQRRQSRTEIAARDSGDGDQGQVGSAPAPVSIWETEDAFHAALIAPGLDEDSISVTIQEGTLSVEGELKFQPPEGARMIWQEFGPTRFHRVLRLGTPVDRDRIEAVYRNGLLMLTIPKSELAKPHRIAIRAGAQTQGA